MSWSMLQTQLQAQRQMFEHVCNHAGCGFMASRLYHRLSTG